MEKEWLLKMNSFNSANPLNGTKDEEWQMKMDNLIHEFQSMSLD